MIQGLGVLRGLRGLAGSFSAGQFSARKPPPGSLGSLGSRFALGQYQNMQAVVQQNRRAVAQNGEWYSSRVGVKSTPQTPQTPLFWLQTGFFWNGRRR